MDNAVSPTRSHLPSSTDDDTTGTSTGMTRRNALRAAGTVAVAGTAGCLDSVSGLFSDQETIDPEAPGEFLSGTPAEFRYLLESDGIFEADGLLGPDDEFDESPIRVDELYHNTDDNDLLLFYESSAETREESNQEIAFIFRVFRRGVIDQGQQFDRLLGDIVNPFDGQVKGWGAHGEWARLLSAERISEEEVFNRITCTMVYPDGSEGAQEVEEFCDELVGGGETDDSINETADDQLNTSTESE